MFTLVRQGRAVADIVLPPDPTPREQYAASELQFFTEEITGCVLRITSTATKDVPSVIIGGPDRNPAARAWITSGAFRKAVPGPEGLMVQSFGSEALLLAGSHGHTGEEERGTVYAVLCFLEEVVGCSLAAYGKPGTTTGIFVPALQTLETGEVCICRPAASLPYRTAIVQYFNNKIPPAHGLNPAFLDWMVRNRFNRMLTMAGIYEAYKKNGMLDAIIRRGIRLTVGHHESSLLFLPVTGNSMFPEAYGTTHPEYYRLNADGQRFRPRDIWEGQWIFCGRSEGAVAQIAENMIHWLRENPAVDIVTLWPNDEMDPDCVCPACAAHSKTENYVHFVSCVAERVTRELPHIRLDMLVYKDLWEYPEGTAVHPAILVDAAMWHATGLRSAGRPDGACILETLHGQEPAKWAAAGASVVFYDYHMGNFGAKQRLLPMADEMQAVLEHFRQTGVAQGVGSQVEPFNIWNNLLNHYVHGRTAYDTGMSLGDHLDRFCRIFGRGAVWVRGILEELEAVQDGQVPLDQAGIYLMTHVDRAGIYCRFEKALRAEPEGVLRDNIRMLRMAFRYSDLEVNGCHDGELRYLFTHFDSFAHNPGYGIYIAAEGTERPFRPDIWLQFASDLRIGRPRELEEGCRLLGMPEEAVSALMSAAAQVMGDGELLAVYRKYLENEIRSNRWTMVWEPVTVPPEAMYRMHTDPSLFCLLAAMETLPEGLEVYRELKIPDRIRDDTLRDVGLQVEKYMVSRGRPGIRSISWIWRHLRGQLFRTGRLQFLPVRHDGTIRIFRHRENGTFCALCAGGVRIRPDGWAEGVCGGKEVKDGLGTTWEESGEGLTGYPIHPRGYCLSETVTLPKDKWEAVLSREDWLLEVHIPKDGGFDTGTLAESVRQAMAFFREHMPWISPKGLYCHTWMFAPQLDDMLPEDSRILAFRNQFWRYPTAGSPEFMWAHVFDEDTPRAHAPADTRLRKAFLRMLDEGQEIFDLRGVWLCEAGDFSETGWNLMQGEAKE